MKSSSRQSRNAKGAACSVIAYALARLLRYLLGISSQPTDIINIHSGWRVMTGWGIIIIALLALCHTVIRLFRPIEHEQGQDPYTLAQAEIQAERSQGEAGQGKMENPTGIKRS
jgi:hypothetical protein